MPAGLRGDHCLLHARQKLLRLEQRKPQMRYVAKVAGRPDLHDVDTRSGAISLRFDQPQNPPHLRSPGRQWPNRSYRLRPHPPTFWTLPMIRDSTVPSTTTHSASCTLPCTTMPRPTTSVRRASRLSPARPPAGSAPCTGSRDALLGVGNDGREGVPDIVVTCPDGLAVAKASGTAARNSAPCLTCAGQRAHVFLPRLFRGVSLRPASQRLPHRKSLAKAEV